MGDICSEFEKEGAECTETDGKFESILDLMQRVRQKKETTVVVCDFCLLKGCWKSSEPEKLLCKLQHCTYFTSYSQRML